MHRLTLPEWQGPPLRIAVLADPHVCLPWVKPERASRIVEQVNALEADLIVLAGDLLPDRNMPCRHLKADRIVPLFRPLQAPLGMHAIIGNHDREDCARDQASDGTDNSVIEAYAASGMTARRNDAVQLCHEGFDFWLVSVDTQRGRGKGKPGFADAKSAFAKVPEGAPAILLAHEPDIFASGESRAFLQISGHTHGGQFTLFGRRPMTPSKYGDRYAIGHITEDDRHLVVSAGIGYSGLPFRFGVPPELTLIEISPQLDRMGGTKCPIL